MTQGNLAKISGVSKSMISAIERQERHPTIPIMFNLAQALRVEMTELFKKDDFSDESD